MKKGFAFVENEGMRLFLNSLPKDQLHMDVFLHSEIEKDCKTTSFLEQTELCHFVLLMTYKPELHELVKKLIKKGCILYLVAWYELLPVQLRELSLLIHEAKATVYFGKDFLSNLYANDLKNRLSFPEMLDLKISATNTHFMDKTTILSELVKLCFVFKTKIKRGEIVSLSNDRGELLELRSYALLANNLWLNLNLRPGRKPDFLLKTSKSNLEYQQNITNTEINRLQNEAYADVFYVDLCDKIINSEEKNGQENEFTELMYIFDSIQKITLKTL